MRFLAGRGFSGEVIRRVLRERSAARRTTSVADAGCSRSLRAGCVLKCRRALQPAAACGGASYAPTRPARRHRQALQIQRCCKAGDRSSRRHASDPATPPARALHEDSRVPRQGNLAQLRRAGAARHSCVHRAGSGGSRAEARRPGLGGQGADPRRRPRQGRRRQAGALARRRQDSSPARSWACSSRPTRPAPKARRCAAC